MSDRLTKERREKLREVCTGGSPPFACDVVPYVPRLLDERDALERERDEARRVAETLHRVLRTPDGADLMPALPWEAEDE